jgi:hypothetical protein
MKIRLVISVLVLIIVGGSYLYFSQTKLVETTLVHVQKNKGRQKLEFPYLVSHSVEDMNFVLFKWLGDSLTLINNIDFLSNDYLVTFGRPLKDVCYYVHISHPDDDCDYLGKYPLKIHYQEKYTDSVYFYKIQKGKYRNLCP